MKKISIISFVLNGLVIIVLLFWIFFINNKKIEKKTVFNDDITVEWYFYSYLTDVSADYVEICSGNEVIICSKLEYGTIEDIYIEEKSVYIVCRNQYKPLRKQEVCLEGEVFNYKIEYIEQE